MPTFAIGDIHGCLNALETLIESVGFGEGDTVITLGDYVDRGPDSKGVIDSLLALRERTELITLRGNHEIMMLEARHRRAARMAWCRVGGVATLDSYGAETIDDIPARHWDFLESLLPYHETADYIFVHANLDPKIPLSDQPDDRLFWEPFGDPAPHCSGKTMICGHTSHKGGKFRNVGHAICIDTYAWGGGWLTCLEVGSGQVWQANSKGKTRLKTMP